MTLILGTLGLIHMKLAFIIEDLALLGVGERQSLVYERRRAYLIENSTWVVKVSIYGPSKIFAVSLHLHQPDTGSKNL